MALFNKNKKADIFKNIWFLKTVLELPNQIQTNGLLCHSIQLLGKTHSSEPISVSVIYHIHKIPILLKYNKVEDKIN